MEPLPGVEITFPTVNGAGETKAVLTTDVPTLDPVFQVGDPPAFYEISTTADVVFPVTVCIGYGSLPVGKTAKLLHYENGVWVDRTDTVFGLPDNKVCGDVDSFSPFAAVFAPAYALTGPFQPVDKQPTVNAVKAGQTVPVKFSLGGDFGLDIFADDYPRSAGGPCAGGASDEIETTSNGAGLVYDPAAGTYTYHWKTLKTWAGHCRTLTVRFNDGSEFKTNFKFK